MRIRSQEIYQSPAVLPVALLIGGLVLAGCSNEVAVAPHLQKPIHRAEQQVIYPELPSARAMSSAKAHKAQLPLYAAIPAPSPSAATVYPLINTHPNEMTPPLRATITPSKVALRAIAESSTPPIPEKLSVPVKPNVPLAKPIHLKAEVAPHAANKVAPLFRLAPPIPFSEVFPLDINAHPEEVTQCYSPAGHKGIDIATPYGTKVLAATAGTATIIPDPTGYGPNYVVIKYSDAFSTGYGHMEAAFVYNGERVNAGETIGLVGSMGQSTGPHLHYNEIIGVGANPNRSNVSPRLGLQIPVGFYMPANC
jgi:murein DD-endopeptidase MepM/ murein hydrolase activator NlpD